MANLLCVQDTGGAQSIASHTVFMNGYTASTCQTDDIIIEASGTVHVISFAIYLDDEQDDITSDGRFNQADVDFLASIVGTTDAIDPAYAKFDYVNDPTTPTDDGVETQDIEILQCFIDAGLSSGHLADANQNGPLDCEDVALAVAQPFAGEAFPASSYSVEFDADLDGDNDAADKVAIANALLTVEPANFQFDAVLNFFDSTEFTTLYNNNDPRADLFPVGSPDGIFNFFDVVQFQAYYNNPSCL